MQNHIFTGNTYHITAHGQFRLAQRGVCREALELVRVYGVDRPAGNGCVRRGLLRSQLGDLSEEGFALATIERALNLEAVFSHSDELITCYQMESKRRSNLRRNGRHPRSRRSRNQWAR